MDDAVGDEDVGRDDLGAVDVDGAVQDGDGEEAALHALDLSVVGEAGAVGDGAVDDCTMFISCGLHSIRSKFHGLPWYWRMEDSCSMVRLPTAEPMAWKAALLGTKAVISMAESTASTSLVPIRAPAAALRPAASAVAEMLRGTVRTVSMTWRTPPVKLMF